MRILILIFLSLAGNSAFSQPPASISVIDFVKIKNNRKKEALYFYENNWKPYRDIALKNGFIRSYKLLITKPDSTAHPDEASFDLMLVTEYADSTQLQLSEERFQSIIKAVNPNGPKLLNDVKPVDFRQTLFSKKTYTLF